MPKTKISEFSATPANNTDIDSINIAEGCAPSGINDAIRELMSQLKDWQAGTSNDPMVIGSSGSLTLSQGTANGVPYLNGSKVVTSGSALQFDGTSLFVGATSAAAGKLVVKDTSSSNHVWLVGRTSDGASSVSFRNAADSAYNARLEAVSGYLAIETNGNERARITSAGNLGIGTTSPINNGGYGGLSLNGTSGALFSMMTNGTETTRIASFGDETSIQCKASTGIITFVSGVSGGTERARILADGTFIIGKTSTSSSSNGAYFTANGTLGMDFTISTSNEAVTLNNLSTVGTAQMDFRTGGTEKGSITWNNTNTTYNTTSDYRLKNTITPMAGALARVSALKPVTYKWNIDGSDGEGFIAHELAEVVPLAVTGEKDAIREDGVTPRYQGIDTSVLVPMLTAAIQELKAEFDAYKASHP